MLETAAEPDKTWPQVMYRLIRQIYGRRRTRQMNSKHFRKSNEDQVDGMMVAETYMLSEGGEEWDGAAPQGRGKQLLC